MSYEGYEQLLCPNGHYWTVDAHDFDDPAGHICSTCNLSPAWENSVDCANVDGRGLVLLEVDTSEVSCICVDCGDRHVREQVTYKIPKDCGRMIEYQDNQEGG